MSKATAPSKITPNLSAGYAPSVPISVYRELATEMQASQTKVELLKAENQQLIRQNQQLRQEIQKLVESAIYLQQVANSFKPVTSRPIALKREPVPPPVPSDFSGTLASAPKDKILLAEQEEGRYRRPEPPSRAVSGIWLAVAIFLIAIFAFGASFLIVRPLLERR
ncbi:MAG: hypothetical protein GDA56_33210 [Hormoscilla sp. GM7CHS1pb]|nr:hypothetical protein [Hormoscilla sp. GM7CHS1pb]